MSESEVRDFSIGEIVQEALSRLPPLTHPIKIETPPRQVVKEQDMMLDYILGKVGIEFCSDFNNNKECLDCLKNDIRELVINIDKERENKEIMEALDKLCKESENT